MDLHNERYFFLSGLISLVLFFFLLVLIGFSVLASPKIEQFAMTQSDVVSISISISDTPSRTEPLQEMPEPKSEPADEKPAPIEEQKPEPEPEISDLFSNVKPQVEPKKKSNAFEREALNALEKEILSPQEKQRFSEKVKNIELVKPGMKMVVDGGSSGPIVNEYHAKIQALIYTHFHPPAGSQGQAARVRIKISAQGKLVSYRVVAYSGSSVLNNEVDWLKERLESLQFPPHPDRKEAQLECILTAKE